LEYNWHEWMLLFHHPYCRGPIKERSVSQLGERTWCLPAAPWRDLNDVEQSINLRWPQHLRSLVIVVAWWKRDGLIQLRQRRLFNNQSSPLMNGIFATLPFNTSFWGSSFRKIPSTLGCQAWFRD
jgi:hypothetical protein